MIYLDNAGTTKIKTEVLDAMMPYLTEYYGNPSALYDLGIESKKAINKARNIIAESLNTSPNNIYFTSGGTESDNWALSFVKPGDHVITSCIEHHAILNKCKELEKNGVEVSYIPVDKDGFVKPKDVANAIKSNTKLVSIMAANNEIGTIQPLQVIGDICREYGVLFHTDAVQAYGHLKIDVKQNNLNMLSASGHKFGAPKGVGFLYCDFDIKSLIYGGEQENEHRAGTENVASIVGMGKAVELFDFNNRKILIDRLFVQEELLKIDGVSLNGSDKKRLDNNINISVDGVDGQALVILLGQNGICASSGSACASSSLEPSHVLKAINVPDSLINSSIRLTFPDYGLSCKELVEVIDTTKRCINMLRVIN